MPLTVPPSDRRILSDLGQFSYGEPGRRLSFSYLGVYAPFPGARVNPLTNREVARMVTSEFLKEYRMTLILPHLRHIGLATDTRPILTPHEPRVPSILAEALVAWRLDRDAERPAHFPPAISWESDTEPERRGWRRWLPVG